MIGEHMLRVGMLRSTKKPIAHLGTTGKAMFYMAKQYNIDMFLFSLDDVDFENKKINAMFLDKTKTVRKTTDFPDVIDNLYNWNTGAKRKKYASVINALEKQCLLTRHYINREKSYVYDLMHKNNDFNRLLIPTMTFNGFNDICKYLGEYNNHIVIKPKNGALGKGIYELCKEQNSYLNFKFYKSIWTNQLKVGYNKNKTSASTLVLNVAIATACRLAHVIFR